MPKQLNDVKIAILTCPFEPPKPKTKHKVGYYVKGNTLRHLRVFCGGQLELEQRRGGGGMRMHAVDHTGVDGHTVSSAS